MKIKTDSKMYKALKFMMSQAYYDLKYNGQTTLCSVVAGLVCFSLVSIAGAIVVTFFSVTALAALFTVTVSMITDVWLPWADMILAITILSCFAIGITAIFSILRLGLHHEDVTPVYIKRWLNLKDEPSESFLSRWLKDRKEKICTIVTLEE